jgi:hypothetical protein
MVEKRSQKMTEYPSIGAFRWMDYFGTLKLYDEGCLEVCCLVTGVGKKCLPFRFPSPAWSWAVAYWLFI